MLDCTISKVVSKKKKKVNILENVLPEMAQNICLYLTPSDVFEVWNSNPRWRYQISDNNFWRKKCRVDNVWLKEESKKSDIFKKLNDRFEYWHSTYYYDYALKNNWKNDIYEETPVKDSSSLNEILLHYFDNETVIVSATPPDKLYVINPLTGAVQKTFPLDTEGGSARRFIIKKFDDKLLLFARLNVFLWNFHTSELLMTTRFAYKIKAEKIRIHKNLIGFNTYNPHFNFYILNMDTKDITLIALDIGIFYFYKNLGILLTMAGSINTFNIDNRKLVNHPCPKNHYIAGMLLKDHYLIAMCEKWHMTTWTIDHINESLTKLISFSIIDCMPSNGDYTKLNKFILLDDTKLGYQIDQCSKFYIWDFVTGMYYFTIDLSKAYLQTKLGNHLVSLSYNYFEHPNSSGCKVWCLKTGKLISSFNLFTNTYFTQSTIIHFTETKLVVINKNVLAIRDFEKAIKTDCT